MIWPNSKELIWESLRSELGVGRVSTLTFGLPQSIEIALCSNCLCDGFLFSLHLKKYASILGFLGEGGRDISGWIDAIFYVQIQLPGPG